MGEWLLAGLAVLLIYTWATGGTADDMTQGSISAFAKAIATAEGFFAQYGANGLPLASPNIPQSAQNPGNITGTGDTGSSITAAGGIQIGIYSSLEAGWDALENLIQSALAGESTLYSPDMTIQQFANVYVNGGAQTAGSEQEAATIAGQLGVSVDTPISEVAG